MRGRKQSTAWEKEYRENWRREQKFLRDHREARISPLDRKLDELAPEALSGTLHAAFVKAFEVVFQKGTGVIGRVGRRENRRMDAKIRQYKAELRENRRNLRAFSRAADRSGLGNTLAAGAAGAGMGLFGVALPDVPLFTAMLLKSVYETAESFGFGHETPEERRFVLLIMETALSGGPELEDGDRRLNEFMRDGAWRPEEPPLGEQVRRTARRLSEAVLYGKVLQNIPVVGVAGGLRDGVLVRRVQRYAAIKYRRRFLLARRKH
ncbi:EcsC family protein [Dysosmobacter sp.]|uniref:EcsC family protein n=1 Tax=Dysosmobacter sp. TaxID=2591382 RepID=UPI002A848399|nr:EcsC family protein [Dysosmobacter sp.]MDY3281391.1 EcsC family protein [Dysosmobacter sp.]